MTALLTESEIQTARERARYGRRPAPRFWQRERRMPEGGGIVIGFIAGAALWTAIGLVLYFTFFEG